MDNKIRSETATEVKNGFERKVQTSITDGSLTAQRSASDMFKTKDSEQKKNADQGREKVTRRRIVKKHSGRTNQIMRLAAQTRRVKPQTKAAEAKKKPREENHDTYQKPRDKKRVSRIKRAKLLGKMDTAYHHIPHTRTVRTLSLIDEKINRRVIFEDERRMPKPDKTPRTLGVEGRGIKIQREGTAFRTGRTGYKNSLRDTETTSSAQMPNSRFRKATGTLKAKESTSKLRSEGHFQSVSAESGYEKKNDHAVNSSEDTFIGGRRLHRNPGSGPGRAASSAHGELADRYPSRPRPNRIGGADLSVQEELTGRKIVTTGRFILPDKRQIYNKKQLNKIYNPIFNQQAYKKVGDATKTAIVETVKLPGTLVFENTKQTVTDKLQNEGGSGGQFTAGALKAPGIAKDGVNTTKFMADGATGAGRLIRNGAKTTAAGGHKLSYLAKESIKSINNYGVGGSFKKVGSHMSNMVMAAPAQIKKKLTAAVKEALKKVILKVIAPVVGLTLFVVLIVMIFLMSITSFLPLFSEAEILADSNSIIVVREYLEELVEEWNMKIDEIKESFLIEKDCPYGNNDTVEVVLECEGEPATVKTEYLTLYALLATKYEMQIQNLGVERGNEFDSEQVTAEELKNDLRDMFYFLNPADLADMTIEQEVFTCFVPGDPGDEDEEGEEDHFHEYRHTKIIIELRTVTKLVAHVCQSVEEIELYNEISGDLLTEAYDKNEPLEWKEGFFDSSPFDEMAPDVWIMYWENDVPVLSITRAEFIALVKQICIPTGQISYLYGGKNIATGALDCSGFTSYMYRLIGFDIGDGTSGQWGETKSIAARQAQPGDLVFKQSPSSNGINHVGIYLGEQEQEGRFAHCQSSTGTIVNSYQGFLYYRRPLFKFADDNTN